METILFPQASTSVRTRVSELNYCWWFPTISFVPALTPFHDDDTTFWTSAATTSTTELGYSYPEFDGLDAGNTDTVRDAISKIVKDLYDPDVSGGTSTDTDASTSETNTTTTRLHDWTARIEFKRFEISSSFSVAIFFGKDNVPHDPKEWEVSPYYVGSYYSFGNSAAESCENCRNNANAFVQGFVHLNQAIVRHSGLKSLEPHVVEPWLTKNENLQWRVLKARTLDDHMTLISSDSRSRLIVKSNSIRSVHSRSLFIPHPWSIALVTFSSHRERPVAMIKSPAIAKEVFLSL